MPVRQNQLTAISMKNFKRFEHLSLDLEPFNLLVGPNNSGKSTVLQACALFHYCYRACLLRVNGKLRLGHSRRQEQVPFPVAHPRDLWLRRPSQPEAVLDVLAEHPI